MWREMALIGQWIGESLIIRWAELTHEITNKQIPVASVIEALLKTPEPDRDVAFARNVFEKVPDIRCVWTSRPIVNDMEVDHALPHSVWFNNDLWNLFPSTALANGQKSDKIVTVRLLHECRSNIIQTWELLRSEAEDRFMVELSRSLLHDRSMSNWQTRAFSGLVENVEMVAVQRGCQRWDGLVPSTTWAGKRSRVAIVSSQAQEPVFLDYKIVKDVAFREALPYVGDLAAGELRNGFFFGSLDECRNAKWVRVPKSFAGNRRFVVKVDGDSMEPTLHRGELLVFEYHRSPRLDGKIVIAILAESDDSEPKVAIKRLRQDRNNWRITSDNPAYPEQVLSKDIASYPILGTYVGKVGWPTH
jgi:phage repressor protein C with HTH and peptisase S24 domain